MLKLVIQPVNPKNKRGRPEKAKIPNHCLQLSPTKSKSPTKRKPMVRFSSRKIL